MTLVTYYGLSDYSFNAYGGELTFSSFVGSSSNTYVFTNTDGTRVTMNGENIVVDGDGRFVSGTIEEITISPRGRSPFEVDVRITDLGIDGTDILGSGGSNVPNSDEAWRAVMDGDARLVSDSDGRIDFAMDGPRLRGNETLDGGDNSASGDFGVTSYIMGSIAYVYDTATVNGGTFDFDGQARYVLGDVWNLYDSTTLRGGDDSLTFDPGTAFPDLHAETTILFSGDARGVREQSLLEGGDDVINMRKAVTSETVYVFGDATYLNGTATVVGGDDVIMGARTSVNNLYGDVQTMVENTTFVGGDDIIHGGNRGDVIYGDHGSDPSYGVGGDDTLFGGNGNDTMYGGGGDDRLYNAWGNTENYGGDGDDRFIQTADGAHDFYGGAGRDYIDYSNSNTKVIIDLQQQKAWGGWADNDTFDSVEVARGSKAGDTLYGSEGQDALFGDNGNDLIVGRGGGDLLYAGRGSDQFLAADGGDFYFGGKGSDTLDYGQSDGRINVNLANGSFKGGFAAGDKAKSVENVFGSEFNDMIRGDGKANLLRGMKGEDDLYGGRGGDLLAGHQGQDELFGGKGADLVYGGTGADEISGGTGNDFLRGGGGKDDFIFKRGDDYDRIDDFQDNRDTLELVNITKRQFDNGVQQVGDDVYVNFGGGDQLYIDDITIQQLRNDIEFV